MPRKKKEVDSDQLSFDNLNIKTKEPTVTELCTPDNQKEMYYQKEMPEEIAKNRSKLMDEVLNIDILDGLNLESEESSELTTLPVKTKVLMSYDGYQGVELQSMEVLTDFDREVMDAISTLAPHMQVMSASDIFRVITGKQNEKFVTPQQREKIDEAMERCGRCMVEIDVTRQYLEKHSNLKEKTKDIKFSGRLISYSKLTHRGTNRGVSTFYKILDMPPIFQLAESIGKVSVFPIYLLNTPVAKTESNIVVQSFLLRTIDDMKKRNELSPHVKWDQIYEVAKIDVSVRQYKQKIRENVIKMLEYWVTVHFIENFTYTTRGEKEVVIFLSQERALLEEI